MYKKDLLVCYFLAMNAHGTYSSSQTILFDKQIIIYDTSFLLTYNRERPRSYTVNAVLCFSLEHFFNCQQKLAKNVAKFANTNTKLFMCKNMIFIVHVCNILAFAS